MSLIWTTFTLDLLVEDRGLQALWVRKKQQFESSCAKMVLMPHSLLRTVV